MINRVPRHPESRFAALIFAALFLGRFGIANPTDANDTGSSWLRVNDDDSAVSYSSNVQRSSDQDCFDGDMHFTKGIGEWCQYSFVGAGAKWIGSKNADHGDAEVYIDGQLDATVSTTAATLSKQQEIYEKTGLSGGPHTLKIVVKTSGYQDFDAFEYLAPPPPLKNLGRVLLPAQVPYLNASHRYPVGNGVAMAVGEATGRWSQLAGPGYTTPNFIDSEDLTLEIDGVEQPLHMEMKRAEKTGIYYGFKPCNDLQVRVIDYAPHGQPRISRLILIDNVSPTASHDVRIRAMIQPRLDSGMTQEFAEDTDQQRCGVFIQADTTTEVPWGGKTIVNKSVVISFTEPGDTAFRNGNIYTVETRVNRVAPNSSYQVALCHSFYRGAKPGSESVNAIRAIKSLDELEDCIVDWQSWFDHVGPRYRLSNIKEDRARRLVEGGLGVIKTNQALDGGIIAHSTYYKEGYLRDAAMALRALTATGHFDESKQWLMWVDHVLTVHGGLPDAANCELSLTDKCNTCDFINGEVEEPGWVLISARDYYRGTHDLDTLNSLHKLLQYCMDVQLKQAVANGDKLAFNGDETEICRAVDISASGSGMNFDSEKEWSVSSLAMCAASLNFYMDYIKLRGEDPAAYHNSQTGTTMNLPAELTSLVSAMDRDFWRTDVPEIPGGFHDAFRKKSDMSWPLKRIVNFSLMPVYFETPYPENEKIKDVAAMAHYFNEKTGFLQLVPGADTGFDGHDLGYLLWGLVETGDSRKDEVYRALVDGPTVDCWGSYNEAYTATGVRNDHDLRSLETGVNLSAIAKYWGLGP